MARFFWPPDSSPRRLSRSAWSNSRPGAPSPPPPPSRSRPRSQKRCERGVAVVHAGGGVALGHRVLEPAHLQLDRVKVGEAPATKSWSFSARSPGACRRWRFAPHSPSWAPPSRAPRARARSAAASSSGAVPPISPTFSPGLCCQVASPARPWGLAPVRGRTVQHGAILNFGSKASPRGVVPTAAPEHPGGGRTARTTNGPRSPSTPPP